MTTRLRDLFALTPLTPQAVREALKTGATSCGTVLVACLLFGPHIGPVALFGSMLAQWEAGRPLVPRLLTALVVGTVMTATMALGVLVAPHRALVVPAVVAVVLLTTTAYYSFQLSRGPGPLHLFYASAIGSYFGLFPAVAWPSVEITAFATALTGFLTLLHLIPDRFRPDRRAIAEAESAVETYDAAIKNGTALDLLRQMRHGAYAAVNRGWLTLQSARLGPFGAGEVATFAPAMLAVNRRLAALVAGTLYPGAPLSEAAATAVPLQGHPGWRFLFRHGFRRYSIAWFTAWRVGVAVALAGYASEVCGLGHPYWSILTAALVLHQWTDRLTTTLRALRRAAGTILGLGVVALVGWIDPSPWALVAVILACVMVMNVLLPLNYALAITFVTPMALLSIAATGHGGTLGELLGDRLVETLLGVGIAIAVTSITGRHTPRLLVRAQVRRAIGAARAALEQVAADAAFQPQGVRARAALQLELLTTTTVLARATADSRSLAAWHGVELALIDLGYAVMSASWVADAPRRLPLAPALAALEELERQWPDLDSDDDDPQMIGAAITRTLRILTDARQLTA